MARMCKHDREFATCKECGGSQICKHGIILRQCRQCGERHFCKHGRRILACKQCGTHAGLRKNGFTAEQIEQMGNVEHCQYPGCVIQPIKNRALHSDHDHTQGREITPANYRGELCAGHNRLLADLDRRPEWASPDALEYMKRRPLRAVMRQLNQPPHNGGKTVVKDQSL